MSDDGTIRKFDTGATRDTADGKLDYEGFLCPKVLKRFAEYMHANRLQSDGSLRDSDNWQKGIPVSAYMSSLWRHFHSVWLGYRTGNIAQTDLCAMLFNVQGILHEVLKVLKWDECHVKKASEESGNGRPGSEKTPDAQTRTVGDSITVDKMLQTWGAESLEHIARLSESRDWDKADSMKPSHSVGETQEAKPPM